MELSPRERCLLALSRRKPDKVPKHASFTPAVYERFKKETGHADPAEYFGMEPRYVGFKPLRELPDFSEYLPSDLPEGTQVDEYGVARVPGGFYHFTKMVHPLANLRTVRELEDYPWPDYTADYRHEHLEEAVRRLQEEGYYVCGSVGHIFETAWYMRGMDRLFMDFSHNPEFAARLLDILAEQRAFQARRMAEAGADCIILGDDVGMQNTMLMSPETWRRWLKPRLRRAIEEAKRIKPDIHVFYHSDGWIEPIIPDLIEVGVTILNPVQPECMDPAEIKRKYGDRLAFWGTIGTQTTMPFGTPDEVRRVVKERIETVGYDGGLLLAPTHVLEPDVPWENIVAFFEAVEEFGRYA